jgi:phospholipid transport system transporter-binding protein
MTGSAASVSATPEGLRVEGVLDFGTVPGLVPRLAGFLGRSPRVAADLSGVTRANSAALALMVEWTRQARAAGCELRFLHVPAQLHTIAEVTGVDEILCMNAALRLCP